MSSLPAAQPLDILAIAAHRDDVEQTCGGTLLKAAQGGQHTGILDLTQGEMGTRGSADDRAREAADAAKILKVGWRRALDIPDGRVENTYENRLKVATVIRETRPRVVILPYWKGRHPDHYTASVLGYEACFLAGLAKLELALSSQPSAVSQTQVVKETSLLAPHRPFKIVYSALYANVTPSFVVDISAQFERRMAALFCYASQYGAGDAGSDLFPHQDEIRERLGSIARFYGNLIGVRYGEPFVVKETMRVDDLVALPVRSI